MLHDIVDDDGRDISGTQHAAMIPRGRGLNE
ncbi:hypothetical protein CCHR01_14206 [Colletotrichum chrysophilum]|uniref:Uncharacterized protein n=1 Tax=Colletotrichum chrysophilum TaxID=1836956 RepID=A0AAD9ACW2_9PEZI|nr:hypothetical protein CCHR01_14206 [Colletotrichum chrysophilum]